MKRKVYHLENEDEFLHESDVCINALDAGIHALVLDYGFHIRSTFKERNIFEARNNILYRLGSSRYHFHLLFKEIQQIKEKHKKLDYKEEPSGFHLILDARQLSFIIDSIFFHLSSVFDYTAIITSLILSKSTDKPNWMKVESFARAKTGIFLSPKTENIRTKVLEAHNDFVRGLYDYRSDLIHRTSDIIKSTSAWDLKTNEKKLLFLCTNLQRQNFKSLGDKESDMAVEYFVRYIILKAILSIAEIVVAFRKYMEENSRSHEVIREDELPIAYYDKESMQMKSPGVVYWHKFDKVFVKQPS